MGEKLPKILYVENSEIARRIITRVLERRGFSVLDFSSGEELMDAMREEEINYDIAGIDRSMSDFDNFFGDEIMWELKKRFPDRKIIACSGYPNTRNSTKGHWDAYILKGGGSEDILRKIKELTR
jgi:CheY-like chemotaxis protein